MKTVGIVGGLGPDTTAEFYLNLIRKFRNCRQTYPSVLIDSVSFPFSLERDIIADSVNEEKILPHIKESVRRLSRGGVDFIAIPCNTVHIFIEELRRESSAPIISIIDETVRYVDEKGCRSVGLLATAKTVDSKLYQTAFRKKKIKTFVPEKESQKLLSEIILRILAGEKSENGMDAVEKIMACLKKKGAEAIVLGCTDLNQIMQTGKNIIDSTEILLQSVFELMK